MDPVAEDQLGRTMDFMQRIERAWPFMEMRTFLMQVALS
jgi:hypothetical protein